MIWAWVTFWVNDWGTRGTGKRRRDEEAAEARVKEAASHG